MISLNLGATKSQKFILISLLFVIITAIFGTRFAGLFYMPVSQWDINQFTNVLQSGELIYHSGLIIGYILISIVILIMRFEYIVMSDLYFVYVPLGHAIGRIACLLVGCCWGRAVFWFDHTFQNPVPLYEIIINGAIFSTALILFNRIYQQQPNRYKGTVTAFYLITYGIARFVIEFFRSEPVVMWGLTQAHFVCLILATIGFVLVGVIYTRRFKYHAGN